MENIPRESSLSERLATLEQQGEHLLQRVGQIEINLRGGREPLTV